MDLIEHKKDQGNDPLERKKMSSSKKTTGVLPRKYVNWNFIEPLYRSGTLSNREICLKYAETHQNSNKWKFTLTAVAISRHAKKNNWQKRVVIAGTPTRRETNNSGVRINILLRKLKKRGGRFR